MRIKLGEVCALARPSPVNRWNPLNMVVEQALVDRLGGVDTQAKGNKAGGRDRADRGNTLTKLTKPAGVDRVGGGTGGSRSPTKICISVRVGRPLASLA